MKTEINLENKAKFFAQYIGHRLDESIYYAILRGVVQEGKTKNDWKVKTQHLSISVDEVTLPLKPISSITDEDAIQVARLAHQMPKGKFNVLRRDEDIIFIQTDFSKVGIRYFISIRYKYGSICSQICFSETEKEKYKQYDNNIGQISMSSELPVPYIAIVDFLRSKGYALPWMGLSVEEMVEAGWIKLKV